MVCPLCSIFANRNQSFEWHDFGSCQHVLVVDVTPWTCDEGQDGCQLVTACSVLSLSSFSAFCVRLLFLELGACSRLLTFRIALILQAHTIAGYPDTPFSMRVLRVDDLRFEEFPGLPDELYAILSHVWGKHEIS